MQFHSYYYILYFYPIFLVLYYLFRRKGKEVKHIIVVAASLLFYGLFGLGSLVLVIISSLANYGLIYVADKKQKKTSIWFYSCVVLDVILLLGFKAFGFSFAPIGISFITFQQIAFVIEKKRGNIAKTNLLDYLSFIFFFPKITMGPLMNPVDYLDQMGKDNREMNWQQIYKGISRFTIGLAKKVLIADYLAKIVNAGYDIIGELSSIDTAVIMLCYTLQIYFDFSGYSDMAIGIAQSMDIQIKENFLQPYRASTIQEFWKRWHISLNAFLTRYIYIPLGGNREGKLRTFCNVMIVFAISGIWHGFGWTFLLWGVLHGLGTVASKSNLVKKIPKCLNWVITFSIVNILWALFRAPDITTWVSMLRTLFIHPSFAINSDIVDLFQTGLTKGLIQLVAMLGVDLYRTVYWMAGICVLLLILSLCKQKEEWTERKLHPILIATILVICILNLGKESIFIYNNF
ncbi:MAG: MBOAT family protein [Lachnospiraceae bacterium]|nr:MBOAT family protein [Lachnospiraceae bacterium]